MKGKQWRNQTDRNSKLDVFIESNDFCAGCGAYNRVGIDADWA